MDLSGKIIIKAKLGHDIRLTPIHNEDITYDELILMMQRVFKGQIQTSDELLIKYKDEDGDLITIMDSSDLSFAIIQCSHILKLTIFVNDKPRPLESDQVKQLKNELRDLRNRVTQILDYLDTINPADTLVINETENDMAALSEHMDGKLQINSSDGKEFDPLSQPPNDDASKIQVMSSLGLQNEAPSVANQRSGSPDSVSSIGSSTSQRHQQLNKSASSYTNLQQNPQGFPPQNQQQVPTQQPPQQTPSPVPAAAQQQSEQQDALQHPHLQQQQQQYYQTPQQQQAQYPSTQYTGAQYQQRTGVAPGQYPQQQQYSAPGQQQTTYSQQGMPPVPTQPQYQQPYTQQGVPGAPVPGQGTPMPGQDNPYGRPGSQGYTRPQGAYQQGYR